MPIETNENSAGLSRVIEKAHNMGGVEGYFYFKNLISHNSALVQRLQDGGYMPEHGIELLLEVPNFEEPKEKVPSLDVDSGEIDLLDQFFTDFAHYRLITGDEEVALAKMLELGTNSDGLPDDIENQTELTDAIGARAREKMIEANWKLVVSMAKKYTGRDVELADLIQYGMLGLHRAVDKFNWRKGYKLSTYAAFWIRQSILRAIENTGRGIRVPTNMHSAIRQMFKLIDAFSNETGRFPTDDEIADSLGLSVDEILFMQSLTVPLSSLNDEIDDADDGDAMVDFVRGPDSTENDVVELIEQMSVRQISKFLSDRETQVLQLRFGLEGNRPHTLMEVGLMFDLTLERIRQIQAGAISKLRAAFKS